MQVIIFYVISLRSILLLSSLLHIFPPSGALAIGIPGKVHLVIP